MISENFKKIAGELPAGVELVIAVKDRNVQEVNEAVAAGARIIGENYINQAKSKFSLISQDVRWHFIGHLQKNKAKQAVKIFDMIETLDSLALAQILDKEAKKIGKILPVLIEINSAGEPQKSGILAEGLRDFLKQVLGLDNLKVMGLMTMGPWLEDPQALRPFFKKTKELFDVVKIKYPDKPDWKYLSMGMSDSYKIAIEEGANIVRLGTAVFGPRPTTP